MWAVFICACIPKHLRHHFVRHPTKVHRFRVLWDHIFRNVTGATTTPESLTAASASVTTPAGGVSAAFTATPAITTTFAAAQLCLLTFHSQFDSTVPGLHCHDPDR
jgi:hypothetical protein